MSINLSVRQAEGVGAVSVKFDLTRTAAEFGVYAVERYVEFGQRWGSTAHFSEERELWFRGVLQGMAEVTNIDPQELINVFEQQLDEGKRRFALVPLRLSGQRHVVQTLRWYADELERLIGDQRARVVEVKNLLEDFIVYLGWNTSLSHAYPAKYEAETHLLRMTARRPIRFTRVVVGGDMEPDGIEFMPGRVDDAAEVRRTQTFQEIISRYAEWAEWPALCTVYLGGGRQRTIDTVDADELDMAVIREAGEQFLKQPGITAVSHRELCVPIHEIVQEKGCSDKPLKRRGPER